MEGGGQACAAAGAGGPGADTKGEMSADLSRLVVVLAGTQMDFSLFRSFRQPPEDGGLWVYGSRSVVHSKLPQEEGLPRGVMLVWAVWRRTGEGKRAERFVIAGLRVG